MSETAHQRFSFADYIRLEEYSNVRHEFLDGVTYAMAGGSPAHSALAARIIRRLGSQLAGRPCEVFTSDLRVRVAATGLVTYPDVSVVCGPIVTDPEDPATILNPVVVVEVLSPSTEEYDRGEKLSHYRRIEALREIVLVASAEPRLEMWRRSGAGWEQVGAGPGEIATLMSIGAQIEVDDLYRDLPADR